MRRLLLLSLLASTTLLAVAQTPSTVVTSDAQAVSLAQQAMLALTAGNAVNDVTLNANVTSNIGPDLNTGTGLLRAKGIGESRIDLNLNGGTLTETRNTTNGIPAGGWARNGGSATSYAQHNCWTDASWFFPSLSSLARVATPNFVFKYIGAEIHNGVSTQHIQLFQVGSNDGGIVQKLSEEDVFLDPSSHLPLAIAFNAHADDNMNIDLPTEIRFANYQPVNGIQIPFHFQKLINGGVVLDVTVTSAAFNSGLSDSSFTIQ